MNTLGERIAYLRNKEGISQRKLMDILGFQNLSKYEKDTREPNLDILKLIATYFHVTIDWLVTGHDVGASLSHDETEVIDYYRKLSDKQQKILIEFLQYKVNEQPALTK